MPDALLTHKCTDCGFLTLRNAITGQLDEVDWLYRDDAKSPKLSKQSKQGTTGGSQGGYDVYPYTAMPLCFVQRHELWRDFKGLGPDWQTASPDLLPESQI